MSKTYKLMIFLVHSGLESQRSNLTFSSIMSVEEFMEISYNQDVISEIVKYALDNFEYELSHSQICNGVSLFLEALN